MAPLTLNTQPLAPGETTSADSDTVYGTELLQWFEQAFPILRDSAWGPFLQFDDIDVLDAVVVALYLNSLMFLRRDKSKRNKGAKQKVIGRARLQAKQLGSRMKQSFEERAVASRSAPLQHADILFWPVEPTHIKALLPVLHWLDHAGINYAVFACRSKVFQELKANGITPISPYAYWGGRLQSANRAGRRQGRKLSNAEPIDIGSISALDDTAELVELVRTLTARQMPLLHESQVNCEEIFRKIKPRAIVVGSDITSQGRIACRLAKSAGIPTSCLMHGVFANNPMHGLHIAERYLVHGVNAKKFLSSLGFPAERVGVCGAPYLDSYPKQTGEMNEAVRRNLKLDPSKPYVLAATSGPGNTISHKHHTQTIETLCRASIQLPDVQIVSKLHRKDHVNYYNQVLARVPGANLHIVPYGEEGYPDDIFDWLQGSSILLTGGSAVAIEAMLLDVPVVTMDFADEIGGIDFISQGATTHVTTPEELIDAIGRIANSPEGTSKASEQARDFLNNTFLSIDGRSAERVGSELCRLAGLSNE